MPSDDRRGDRPREGGASLGWLRRLGWTVAEYTIWYAGERTTAWLVAGESGRERLTIIGPTRAVARLRACEEAEAIVGRSDET